jgi:hypothetical protein
VGFLTIAQSASAKGTMGLAVLFRFLSTVFYRQVLANRDTLQEVQQSRTEHERPHVLITAESRHLIFAEIIVSNTSAGVLQRTSRSSSLYPWGGL